MEPRQQVREKMGQAEAASRAHTAAEESLALMRKEYEDTCEQCAAAKAELEEQHERLNDASQVSRLLMLLTV